MDCRERLAMSIKAKARIAAQQLPKAAPSPRSDAATMLDEITRAWGLT